ncbi:hypothetical protein [Fuscibacter oryzae]|uniref:Uncharacterized protein n=1 Tax=Fuscibacter oryzae TaxID=2803939 RepID=A0A8J7MVF0_9RHOB|nr:hypothetical protein [Fuscibacter oryzae]MBL4928234.1 hypothetical protein [Fuscibacter oryzae]
MARKGCFGHAKACFADVSILVLGCNVAGSGARGKLSTVSVDKFAEKFSGEANFPCILARSLHCTKNKQNYNQLKIKGRILIVWQGTEKSQDL